MATLQGALIDPGFMQARVAEMDENEDDGIAVGFGQGKKINFRWMGKDRFKTKGFSSGYHTFPHFRGQGCRLIAHPFRVVGIHGLGYQVGIDKFDTVFCQIVVIKGRFSGAVPAGQNPELLSSGHHIASKLPL